MTGPLAHPPIPPELVWPQGFDAFTRGLDDPYHATSRLEGAPPVIWVEDLGMDHRGGWLVTRHDVMVEVLQDTVRFSTERPSILFELLGVELKLNPVDYDPPAHHGYRVILQPLFSPRAINSLSAAVRQTCDTLISRFADQGGCEFVHDFGVPFPSHVFLDMMGMPKAMLPQFLEWETRFQAKGADERRTAARSIYAYLESFLEEQRQAPSGELVKAILNGRYEGRPLNHLEIMGMLYVLYLAGLDTVTCTLGWVMRHLATHPELQARLRAEPGLIPDAVEEFLRAFPVAQTFRRVTQDCVFHDAPLRAGDEIRVPMTFAGRDSRIYDDPHVIDIGRKARHLAFGTGPHVCLGAHLARREMAIVIESFLQRFRDIRIAEGETYRFHTAGNFAVDYLPLRWDLPDAV